MALFKTAKQNLKNSTLLKDRYIVPPFSILNSITGTWQNRKDRWESLGIYSADGRDVKRNNAMPINTFSARGIQAKEPERTSTFDPVLCEIVYKWFSKPGYTVLDPFAGGSVRGIVANALGRHYTGVDINPTQIEANEAQLSKYSENYTSDGSTKWILGDATHLSEYPIGDKDFDLVFTCPPYYNLEVYTQLPEDLSTCDTYTEFKYKYGLALRNAARRLKENRFFVLVVSEIRNWTTGEYYGFVPDSIKILMDAGLTYYNEIILENNIGSLPIRAPKYFDQSRKIGKMHQNILVFYKGNTKNIEAEFGKFSEGD